MNPILIMLKELEAAKKKHPIWPEDFVYASAILNEEAGELTQATLNYYESKSYEDFCRMREEAAQTGAMAIRFLEFLDEHEGK